MDRTRFKRFRRIATAGLLLAALVWLTTSVHWLLFGSYLITLAKVLLLLFGPAFVLGGIVGAIRRELGQRRSRAPGWVWYGLVELAATVTRKYPFFWGNVADMIMQTPRPWIAIPIGLVAGLYCLREAGRASDAGFRLAARMLGFSRDAETA